MLALSLCTLLVGLLSTQEPSSALQQGLDNSEPAVRRATAQEIAVLGSSMDGWLEKEFGKGAPIRQRSLLLSAALSGTDRGLALVERAARRGRRPDPQRAWSLLLYGAFHPDAGLDPQGDWRRAASSFEQACFLGGLLGAEHSIDLKGLQIAAGKRLTPRVLAMLQALIAVQGGTPEWKGESPESLSAEMLCSLLPGAEPVPAERWSLDLPGVDPLWSRAALRLPGRSLSDLTGAPLGGEHAVLAFALHEIPEEDRQAGFDFLKKRMREQPGAAWLWGSAGDLGLDLGGSVPGIPIEAQAAGLLRLAIHHDSAAREAALRRLPEARAIVAGGNTDEDTRWAAASVLALAGATEDHAWFRTELENAPPAWRLRLQPLWLLTSGKLDSAEVRQQWLNRWSRELGAGRLGYLDIQAPRWVALLLLAGTVAAEENVEIGGADRLTQARPEHPLSDQLYDDMVEFLFFTGYRWAVPSDQHSH